jgi:uncharacterized membrane protein
MTAYDALDLMAGFIVTVSIVCLIGCLAWLAIGSVKRRYRTLVIVGLLSIATWCVMDSLLSGSWEMDEEDER